MKKIDHASITHAVWTSYEDSKAGQMLPGMAVAKYLRFNRMVSLGEVKVNPIKPPSSAYIRQPAHVQISYYKNLGESWQILLDKDLPTYNKEKPHSLKFDNIKTDNLRIFCDREHPLTFPDHIERWLKPEIVPFAILDKTECYGEILDKKEREPIYNPPLKKGSINPIAPQGMEIIRESHQIKYFSPFFSIGFSLIRPILTHLGWDSLAKGSFARDSLIASQRVYEAQGDIIPLDSGPFLSTLKGDIFPRFWTGEVEVDKNKIIYTNLKAINDLIINLEFEVHKRGVNLTLKQHCKKKIYALEADAFRFVWEGRKSVTGTEGIPEQISNRTGVLPLPARWNSPGYGIVGIKSKSPAIVQVDTWRARQVGWSGLVIGAEQDKFGTLTFNPGTTSNEFTFTVEDNIKPAFITSKAKDMLPEGITRHWGSAFGFRPELSGNSNNSMSLSCLLVQAYQTDMAAYAQKPKIGPHPIELARYTITLALKGGPSGYSRRELSIDSDPNLICAAGRIHQVAPDKGWLKEAWPFIYQATERILKSINKDGLMVCKALSGNAGSDKWSSNTWDCISFGHLDAYSNAFGYRALRNSQAMALAMEDMDTAKICQKAADKLKSAYYSCFYNPKTGWLVGWISRDGKLHDYGFTFINAMAICLGLVDGEKAYGILDKLEKKRKDLGLDYFHYGIPVSLIPVRAEDQPLEVEFLPGTWVRWNKRADGLDRFGIYINGGLWTVFAEYYLRALSLYDFNKTADLICEQLNQSFATNRTVGGAGTGAGLRTFEGRPCGYEGTLTIQFNILQSMAKHWGLIETLRPEWWPSLK